MSLPHAGPAVSGTTGHGLTVPDTAARRRGTTPPWPFLLLPSGRWRQTALGPPAPPAWPGKAGDGPGRPAAAEVRTSRTELSCGGRALPVRQGRNGVEPTCFRRRGPFS